LKVLESDNECLPRLINVVCLVLQAVSLRFYSALTQSCCDFVYIYDGYDMSASLLARLSGNFTASTTYNSTQSYMYLRFVTDNSVSAQGFAAEFWSIGKTQLESAEIIV
jgi:hypothetical protein